MLLLLGGHTQSTSSWTCSWWGKVLCKVCLKCISLYKPCSICHYSDIALRLSHVFFVFANWEVKETRITFKRPFVGSDHAGMQVAWWDTKHRTDKNCFALERFCLENLGAMLEYWFTKLSLPLILLLCAILLCVNRPFLSYLSPLFHSEPLCKAFHMEMSWFASKWTCRQNTRT